MLGGTPCKVNPATYSGGYESKSLLLLMSSNAVARNASPAKSTLDCAVVAIVCCVV